MPTCLGKHRSRVSRAGLHQLLLLWLPTSCYYSLFTREINKHITRPNIIFVCKQLATIDGAGRYQFIIVDASSPFSGSIYILSCVYMYILSLIKIKYQLRHYFKKNPYGKNIPHIGDTIPYWYTNTRDRKIFF